MPRDQLLTTVRTALGRSSKQGIEAPPPVYLCVPEVDRRQRITDFRHKLELLAGKTECVNTVGAASTYVESVIAGRDAVASNSPFLDECGIPSLTGVRSKIYDPAALRAACSS